MDLQLAFNIAVGLLGALAGFVLKTLWSAVERLRENLTKLESTLPDKFVRRDDFAAALDRIESKIDRLFDRLESKADK